MEMQSSLPCSQERAIAIIINQMYPVPRPVSYSFKIHFNIIVTCILRSSRLSVSLLQGFSTKCFVLFISVLEIT